MPSGDMWWAKSVVTQTNNPPDVPVSGFTWKFVPTGIEFSGVVIGPPGPLPPSRSDWRVEIRSDYFLDPPRMPGNR